MFSTDAVSGITIQFVTKNEGGRKYDKKHFCLYCGAAQSKIARHIENQHQDCKDVVALQNATKDVRRAQLDRLRNQGDHMHNTKVLKSGQGIFVVGQRPPEGKVVKPEDYVPCPCCYIYVLTHDLWRHKCKHNQQMKISLRKARAIAPSSFNASDVLSEVLTALKNDVVARVVKSDWLILEFGGKMCHKFREPEQHAFVRENLRRLGRLLIQLRLEANLPNASLRDFVDPKYFKTIQDATRKLCSFTTSGFRIPSLALKVGHSLKKIAAIVETEALMTSDALEAGKAAAFLKVLESHPLCVFLVSNLFLY